jgi:phosphatidylglycerophosphatase A
MTELRLRLARAAATMGGLGDRLPAPGTTAGSLPAAVLWWAACQALPATGARIIATAAALVAATAVGIWAAELEIARRGARDPGPVVIDEVAGLWLTFLAALPFVGPLAPGPLAVFAGAGFLLFRFFDIVKPWPVSSLERFPGGIGVVADDLAAGYLAAICLVVGWRLLA